MVRIRSVVGIKHEFHAIGIGNGWCIMERPHGWAVLLTGALNRLLEESVFQKGGWNPKCLTGNN